MGALRLWGKRKQRARPEFECLEQELWKAHRDWEQAQRRLDYALGVDEVDYAVYMLEAAEKRYDMLLRKTKQAHAENVEQELELADKRKLRRGGLFDVWKEGKGWNKDG